MFLNLSVVFYRELDKLLSLCSSSYLSIQVVDRCDMNKMTAANLAVVFGPNLVWANDRQMSLTAIGTV